MEKNKTGKYLKYAIGEIILVVIGILFALQINNWNIKNVQQMEGKTYLTSIKSNLVQDTLVLRLTIQNIKLTLKTLDSTAGLISMNESILLKGSDITNAMLTTHNFVTEKYLIVVEGYSLLSNIGFIKIEIGIGISKNDIIIRIFDKIGLDLFVNYFTFIYKRV